MKEKTKRVVTAVTFVIVVAIVLIINIPIVDTIMVTILSLIGIYEYNNAFKAKGMNPIPWLGYLGCISIFLMGGMIPLEMKMIIIRIAVAMLLIISFIYMMLQGKKHTVVDITISIFSLLYVPFMFSFIKLLMSMEHGRILVIFAFLGASISDTCAYEIGTRFGKRKLCERISPKKTVEGSIAGIAGVVISYVILAWIANHFYGMELNIIFVIVMGICTSVLGQFGDLSASTIKRYCGIKDFGTLMPGHGGILDRCDSILFTAPAVYFLIKIYMFLL